MVIKFGMGMHRLERSPLNTPSQVLVASLYDHLTFATLYLHLWDV